jgi:NAD(P)-dependent dehydrogenase (short-subunit alcohol dehydrogenase family)
MRDNILGLEGRTALVMGGGFGIGRETALLLAAAGANVAIGDIDPSRAEAVADEVKAQGVLSAAAPGDARIEAEARRMVDVAADLGGGRLDVLVNIVGLASWVSLLDVDDETWDHDLNMNLRHHLYVGRAAARRMIEAGVPGRIAMVASVDGYYGSDNHPAYGVAKAGVISLVKTMAQEWGHHGIRVNAVAPDAILTPRVRVMLEQRGLDPEATEQFERPIARMGSPAEIAGPLVFLVSDLSSFVSGQTLIVDGGLFGVSAGHRASTNAETQAAPA